MHVHSPLKQNDFNVQFKIVLTGDVSVGKTSFANRFISALVQKKHIGNQPVQIFSIPCLTKHGIVKMSLWDVVHQQSEIQVCQEFYVKADAALIIFDTMSRQSYKSVPKWYKDIVRIAENIPIVLLGNKVDQKERKVKPKMITFHRKRNLQYYDISTVCNYQIQKPLLYLLRKLTGDATISFISQLPKKQAQIVMEPILAQSLDEQWHNTINSVAIDDDD